MEERCMTMLKMFSCEVFRVCMFEYINKFTVHSLKKVFIYFTPKYFSISSCLYTCKLYTFNFIKILNKYTFTNIQIVYIFSNKCLKVIFLLVIIFSVINLCECD